MKKRNNRYQVPPMGSAEILRRTDTPNDADDAEKLETLLGAPGNTYDETRMMKNGVIMPVPAWKRAVQNADSTFLLRSVLLQDDGTYVLQPGSLWADIWRATRQKGEDRGMTNVVADADDSSDLYAEHPGLVRDRQAAELHKALDAAAHRPGPERILASLYEEHNGLSRDRQAKEERALELAQKQNHERSGQESAAQLKKALDTAARLPLEEIPPYDFYAGHPGIVRAQRAMQVQRQALEEIYGKNYSGRSMMAQDLRNIHYAYIWEANMPFPEGTVPGPDEQERRQRLLAMAGFYLLLSEKVAPEQDVDLSTTARR